MSRACQAEVVFGSAVWRCPHRKSLIDTFLSWPNGDASAMLRQTTRIAHHEGAFTLWTLIPQGAIMTAIASPRDVLERTLADFFQIADDEISDDVTFTDMGIDSLSVIELIDALCSVFDLRLADDALKVAMTVKEAVEILEREVL